MKSKKDTVFFWIVAILAVVFFLWAEWYEKDLHVKGSGPIGFTAFMMLAVIGYLKDKYH